MGLLLVFHQISKYDFSLFPASVMLSMWSVSPQKPNVNLYMQPRLLSLQLSGKFSSYFVGYSSLAHSNAVLTLYVCPVYEYVGTNEPIVTW